MSINPKSSAEQEQSVPPDGADSGSSSSPRASDRVRRRQIFICYPRDARKDVDRFHETLFEALKKRSRSYEVFRDKGEEHDHRINPGEFWRDVIEAKLESSICCIVALVPAIFESKECRKEITKFQSLIKAGQGRFFFPIDFLEVQPVIRQLAAKKDDIASLMLDLDRCNFVGAGFEDNRAYEKKVDGIADTIHRRINKLLEGTGVGELLPPPPPPPPASSPPGWPHGSFARDWSDCHRRAGLGVLAGRAPLDRCRAAA
jgi:hypothetical protein